MSLYTGSLRQWHWISSALCLAGMLLFAVTGITLNHAGQIEASPSVETIEQALPPAVLDATLAALDKEAASGAAPLPAQLRQWLSSEFGIRTGDRIAEWTTDEIYLSMPRPGGDAWLSIDLAFGELLYESTSRGVISYLNDLHKARNTGLAWSWFIDIFSVVCVVFCLTGLLLLCRQQRSRPMTWPVTGLGLLIPVLLALLFIHN
ncbi:MAG: PepSY-associated TM helix domain-containing protein [Pseudohongiella sp.]|uniref:PepSY-associated TM helix domain-containing protein n=1 Tax=Pseudohongiella sp. TaxID=1979412 RepID=UPI0034A03FC3